MTKPQVENENKIRVIKWDRPTPLTQEEAEARLHQEGYQSFCWYDVPGTEYPKHKHKYDECLWILRGEIVFHSQDGDTVLKGGDRIYLPAEVPHQLKVPKHGGVTFLVGQRKP